MKEFRVCVKWTGISWEFPISAPDESDAKRQAKEKIKESGRDPETADISCQVLE